MFLHEQWSKPTSDIPLNPGWLIGILRMASEIILKNNWVWFHPLEKANKLYTD